ncbi:efflux transporter outer membrane subunit [Niveibacterium terrae]|uniref:efflux transporter outer membrane subunit n=1 Tax=Niveibacterium terrae TaxID=3373598 RepID=UPI003A8F31B3
MRAAIACLLFLSGCANLAPDYARPASPVPASIGGAPTASALADPPAWRELIGDIRLRAVVELTLANNRNLRIAALNVEKARAQYRITDADRYPTLDASVGSSAAKNANTITRKYSAELGVSYELDFFGRLRNLKDAALESFLASEASGRSTRISLISEVTDAWLTLASDQALLSLARDTLDSRQKTLDLTRKQKDLGYATELALAQQQGLAETARIDVARYQTLVVQDRNALILLVGRELPDELLPDGADALSSDANKLIEVPAGLSSDVLLHRPDILSAEHSLKASYADIGAARAAFFPSVSLTAQGGTSSSSLAQLFKAGSGAWSFAPQITVPIFNAGSLKASLSSAEIERDIQVATYEQAVQTAFREVADALAERERLGERLQAQRTQVDSYRKVLELTRAKYAKGYSSTLDVLDAERTFYGAQQSLIALQLTEQLNRIALFKVLGGGGAKDD